MARVYLAKIFGVFANESKVFHDSRQYCSEYYEALGHLVWDISPRVAFEAIHGLAELGWEKIAKEEISIRTGFDYLQSYEEKSILQRIIDRLILEITDYKTKAKKSQCILSAALRATITLAKTFASCNFGSG